MVLLDVVIVRVQYILKNMLNQILTNVSKGLTALKSIFNAFRIFRT